MSTDTPHVQLAPLGNQLAPQVDQHTNLGCPLAVCGCGGTTTVPYKAAVEAVYLKCLHCTHVRLPAFLKVNDRLKVFFL